MLNPEPSPNPLEAPQLARVTRRLACSPSSTAARTPSGGDVRQCRHEARTVVLRPEAAPLIRPLVPPRPCQDFLGALGIPALVQAKVGQIPACVRIVQRR